MGLMTVSWGTCATRAIAIMAATAVAWPLSSAPPGPPPVTTHAVTLTAAALPTTPFDPYDGPSLFDLIRHGIVIPSLGQAPPTPPAVTPIPGTTSANTAIKNIYNAVEPWVRYGFELATYAVGWVPYVGWLSGQIMIFYNFGERIARSLTFNAADWLFGPLPFLQGLGNVARDSWNALVQLGIDEWNFFLPPLPPLPPFPLAARQATKVATDEITPSPPAPTTKATGHSLRQTAKPAPTKPVATKSAAAQRVRTVDKRNGSATGQSGRTKGLPSQRHGQGNAHSNRK